jgi:hypothetical protein
MGLAVASAWNRASFWTPKGAEKLVGRGDMLGFRSARASRSGPGYADFRRRVSSVVSFVKKTGSADYDEGSFMRSNSM